MHLNSDTRGICIIYIILLMNEQTNTTSSCRSFLEGLIWTTNTGAAPDSLGSVTLSVQMFEAEGKVAVTCFEPVIMSHRARGKQIAQQAEGLHQHVGVGVGQQAEQLLCPQTPDDLHLHLLVGLKRHVLNTQMLCQEIIRMQKCVLP